MKNCGLNNKATKLIFIGLIFIESLVLIFATIFFTKMCLPSITLFLKYDIMDRYNTSLVEFLSMAIPRVSCHWYYDRSFFSSFFNLFILSFNKQIYFLSLMSLFVFFIRVINLMFLFKKKLRGILIVGIFSFFDLAFVIKNVVSFGLNGANETLGVGLIIFVNLALTIFSATFFIAMSRKSQDRVRPIRGRFCD